MQLRELALLNGTLRENDGPRCSNCGASTHKSWQVCASDYNNMEYMAKFTSLCSVQTSRTLPIMLFVLLAEESVTFRGIAELKCSMTNLETLLEWTTATKLTKRLMNLNYSLFKFEYLFNCSLMQQNTTVLSIH